MAIVISLSILAVIIAYHLGAWIGRLRGFDAGWVHRHLDGDRWPWYSGQPWRGNGLSRRRLRALRAVPDRIVTTDTTGPTGPENPPVRLYRGR